MSDDDANRDGVTTQLLRHVAFRQFYTLVRDDVDGLADLRNETFAKRFEYWEKSPAAGTPRSRLSRREDGPQRRQEHSGNNVSLWYLLGRL